MANTKSDPIEPDESLAQSLANATQNANLADTKLDEKAIEANSPPPVEPLTEDTKSSATLPAKKAAGS